MNIILPSSFHILWTWNPKWKGRLLHSSPFTRFLTKKVSKKILVFDWNLENFFLKFWRKIRFVCFLSSKFLWYWKKWRNRVRSCPDFVRLSGFFHFFSWNFFDKYFFFIKLEKNNKKKIYKGHFFSHSKYISQIKDTSVPDISFRLLKYGVTLSKL